MLLSVDQFIPASLLLLPKRYLSKSSFLARIYPRCLTSRQNFSSGFSLLCLSAGALFFGLAGCSVTEDNLNLSPTATVVASQDVEGGEEMILSVDAADEDGTIARYEWSQLSGTEVELENADTSEATFTAPVAAELEVLVFQVSVMDNEGAFAFATIRVTVTPGLTRPEDLTAVTTGLSVTLDWSTVEAAETYTIYRAEQTFSAISDLTYYTALEGATRQTGLVHSTYTYTGLTSGTTYYFVASATHSNGEESLMSDEVARTIGQEFVVNAPLNDTTVRRCMAGGNTLADCPVDGLRGQDGDYGRTADNEDNLLAKTGSGPAGFDFTPLDSAGEEIEDVADAACVRDNHTGLLWELKLPADGYTEDELRYVNNRYTWFSGNEETNGGEMGDFLGSECGGGYCNTQSYYSELNRLSFCGVTSWRMPTVTQLRNVSDIAGLCEELDYSSGCWFAWGEHVWSANSYALDPAQAWGVNLGFEDDVRLIKSSLMRVLMVADAPEEEDSE